MMLQFAEHTCSHHVAYLDATKKGVSNRCQVCDICEDGDLSLVPGAPPAVSLLIPSDILSQIHVPMVVRLFGYAQGEAVEH